MAKRFSDTGKWGKEWFRKLPVKMKCVWEYLRDNCDSVGVWDGDFGLMSFQLGDEVTPEECEAAFGRKRFVCLPDGKCFLPGFVPFQYKRLNPDNKTQANILSRYQDALSLVADPISPDSRSAIDRLLIDSRSTHDQTPIGGLKKKKKEKEKEIGEEKKENRKGEGECEGEFSAYPVSIHSPPRHRHLTSTPGSIPGLEDAFEVFRETLRHFGQGRTLLDDEKAAIIRAIQRHGPNAVKLALAGARYEPVSDRFKPADFFSLSRCLEPKNFQRFLGLGAKRALASESAS